MLDIAHRPAEVTVRKLVRGRVGPLMLAAAALGLAGCAGTGPKIPDEPGLYVISGPDGKTLTRLGGEHEETWAAQMNLPRGTRFVAATRGLGEDPSLYDNYVTLRKAAWLRSEVTADGTVKPATGQYWVIPTLEEYEVPLDYQYLGTDDGVTAVEVVPQSPLETGLYRLSAAPAAGRAREVRFGVNGRALNSDSYAQRHCVDRLIGQEADFRPCQGRRDRTAVADQTTASRTRNRATSEGDRRDSGTSGGSSGIPEMGPDENETGRSQQTQQQQPARKAERQPKRGLDIRDFRIERAEQESGDLVLVKGKIYNNSQRTRSIPVLVASVLDANGDTLSTWEFTANARELGPQESTSFTAVRRADNLAGKTIRVQVKP